MEDLVYALAFYNAMLRSGYEFSCTFKDSILEDEATERENDRADVALGAMKSIEHGERANRKGRINKCQIHF